MPYVPCDIYALKENIIKVNPNIKIFETSATTGEGIDVWCDFLKPYIRKGESKGAIGNFFDKMAPDWDKRCYHDYAKLEILLSKINIEKGDKILDVGTGTGVLIPFLSSAVGNEGDISAIDASSKMIEEAKKKFGLLRNVSFSIADIESIQPEGTFNHIILYSMYPHLKRPIDTICSFIKHNLAPGGNLLIAHSQSKEEINSMHHAIDETVKSMQLPAIEELITIFESKGVKVIESADTQDYYFILRSNKKE